ncbi:MAG: hypothetical protein LBG60_01300 [Bifidobacteriaceae bacterium]|jgi:hypothetical protein|nr:hypothetical protein [Bifidobacteriaceae bacterium]
MVFTVETVTDRDGQVVRRGACGAVSESAVILPPPEPVKPKITTSAPQHANTGEKIQDEAVLTGPFPQGTVIEFYYQHTPFTDPAADLDELACEAPDPASTEGAVKIGATVLGHDIAAGATETLYSPEFTSDVEGCTRIKETAYAPGEGPGREVLAEGRFDALGERTMWRQPPPPPGDLPLTGANAGLWVAAAGLLAGSGVVLMLAACLRRRAAGNGDSAW